ncbi:MAG: hypothetical protein H8E15_14325 [Planctomycetes bacterium]|nr:hypothetical protein [Planctomycetota bacterium]
MRLVTVGFYYNQHKAHLGKLWLDQANIDSVLADIEIVIMNWLYVQAIGFIKPQVREEDSDRASEVLNAPPLQYDGILNDDPG